MSGLLVVIGVILAASGCPARNSCADCSVAV
jgi:hypothetical protein